MEGNKIIYSNHEIINDVFMTYYKEDVGDKTKISNFGDVEGKRITDGSNGSVNELGKNIEEEEKGEFETYSTSCDDIDEIESSNTLEVLVESKPSSQQLAQTSSITLYFNVAYKDGITVYSKNQKNALNTYFEEKSSQPHFDQKEYFLSNQV